MIFHEIYSCYYSCVAKILALAVESTLTDERMKHIVNENAFSESFLTILPSLKNQKWQLIDEKLKTTLKHKPTMPLTTLQLRWIKAISLDPRIKLFGMNTDTLKDIEPLFTPDDYVIFDQYSDGDPYEDETYIKNFRTILEAIHKKRRLRLRYESRKSGYRIISCIPIKLEYSEKDDKFRLLITGCRFSETVNLGRILSCEIVDEGAESPFRLSEKKKEYVILTLTDQRNALDRVMLHFAHFEKQAERLSSDHYRVTIYYDKEDETELVIRVLSFGPMVTVTEPDHFIELIKERLLMQKKLFE